MSPRVRKRVASRDPRPYLAFQGGTKLFQSSSPIPTRLELRWNFGIAYIGSRLVLHCSNIIPT